MMGAVNQAMQGMAASFRAFASPLSYERRPAAGAPVSAQLAGFARGLRGEELVAAAQQFDHFVQLRADDLRRAGLFPPQRFDRVIIGARSFSVQDWRPAPTSGEPVFVKLMVRGP